MPPGIPLKEGFKPLWCFVTSRKYGFHEGEYVWIMVGDKIMYIFLTFEETPDIHCDYLEVVVPLLWGIKGALQKDRLVHFERSNFGQKDDLARMNGRFVNVDDISICVGSGPR
eukprot:358473-Pelagomonas_calceolata.AAC.1